MGVGRRRCSAVQRLGELYTFNNSVYDSERVGTVLQATDKWLEGVSSRVCTQNMISASRTIKSIA